MPRVADGDKTETNEVETRETAGLGLTAEEGRSFARLAENGVYLANVRCACTGRGSGPLREVEEAFGREFAHVGYVPEWPDEPRKPGNNALVATDAAGVVPAGAVNDLRRYDAGR